MSESSTASTRLVRRAGSSPDCGLTPVKLADGNQFFDGTQHVVHIDDQDRRAILHERAGADVLDLSEARVERLHHQFAFAQEAIHHHPVTGRAVAQHDDRQFIFRQLGLVAFKHLMGGEQADLLFAEREMMPAFQGFDPASGQLQSAVDLGQRYGIRLVAHFHQQRAQHGKRERQIQLKAHALAGMAEDADVAANALDHVMNDVKPDAAAGNFRDGCPAW